MHLMAINRRSDEVGHRSKGEIGIGSKLIER
jgi:hypothetical protein